MVNILVTGVGALLGQGIVKALSASSIENKLFGTDYFANAVGLYWVDRGYILPDILNPKISKEKWLQKIIDILNMHNIDIVLVGLDFEIPLFADYRRKIEESTGAKVVVSSPEVVKICKDKWKTFIFLKENGYLYPQSCLPEDTDKFLIQNEFPLVVKPRFGSTSKNLFKVNTKKELEYAIEKCELPIIQKYIGDEYNEFTCGSIFYNSEVLTCVSLKRTLKDGNTFLAYSDDYPDIDDFIVDITKHLKPYGPTNFQLRLTEKGPTVFEINPRFSGTTPIRTMFGINEVEVIVNAVLFGKMPQKIKKKRGIVMRYFENQFVSWEQYREYA